MINSDKAFELIKQNISAVKKTTIPYHTAQSKRESAPSLGCDRSKEDVSQ